MILFNLIVFTAGLFLLYLGAEMLVRSASRLALLFNIRPIIVGLTVVAFGTSSPEFIVSFIAAYSGKIDVSIGNIVGSNITNIALVLGCSVLLKPMQKLESDLKKELYWLTAVSFLFWIFSLNFEISRFEGFIMFALLVVFTVTLIRQSMKVSSENGSPIPAAVVPEIEKELVVSTGREIVDNLSPRVKKILFLTLSILGIGVLSFGSNLTIESAIIIAEHFGVSQIVIGLTLVAFGTSLPELATAIVSVIKNENDILLGNILGSNLFNILGVAGVVAMIYPLPMNNQIVYFNFPVMLMLTLILFFYLLIKGRINRIAGMMFLVFYLVFLYFVVNNPLSI
ncbi:MAG: calcium/sodium antiporter [Calditrichaceae bacterium]